jgi:hypothetical protein
MKELYTVEPDDGTTIQAGGEFTIQSKTSNKYMYCDLAKGTKVTLSDHPSYFKFQKGGDGFNSSENWGAIVFNRSPMSPTSVELYKLRIEENTNPTANIVVVQDGTPTWRKGTGAFMFYKNSDGSYRIASPEIGLSGTPTMFIGLDRDTYSKVQTTLLPGVVAENWIITYTSKPAISATVSPPTIITGGTLNLPPIDVGGILGNSTPSPYTDAQWFEQVIRANAPLTFTPGPVPQMFVPSTTTPPPPDTLAPEDNSTWIWIGVGLGVLFLLILLFILLKKKPATRIKK